MANRIQFLICVLVLIARAGLTAGTNDAVVLARGQPLAWIRTSADKTHFVCDGTDHSFVPWGFNYDHDDAGRFLEYYWADDWAKVTNDFREMKILGANVVRVSPQLCCLMKSPEQPDETNLARLGMLVRLAEETGLYLDVTGLGCYHKDEVPAWYDAMDESARWKVQARYWRAVADVCKDSPAIFCYDLMNEPVPSGDRKGDWLPGQPMDGSYFVQRLTTDMRGRTEKEVAKEWIAEMFAAIRAVDQRHMITVGLACWEATFGPGARSAFCDPEVSAALDFLSVHYYPRQGKLADDLAILKHYDIGKPLVIEEIFPLSAEVETTAEFIRRSRIDADGWISFYWGKTSEEYDKEPGIRAALVGGWLRHFNALREEMLGGTHIETHNVDASPVAVPEPSPKAVNFYHNTMLLIAVVILWNLLIPVAFLFTGFSAKLRSWAEQIGRKWYFSYAIYCTAFCLFYFLLLLPLIFYGRFIFLHHYDLSNQSFARWLYCSVQGAAIVLIGGLAVGWIPFFIIKKSPRRWWLYLGLLSPLYLCFTLWIQPVLIDPLFNKFTPLQNKELEARILAEATRAGIQGSRVYQVNTSVDSKVENAYVTGLMGTRRIVFYDTLLQNMNEDELLFVMGHEMGHYVLWHPAKRRAFKSILILVSLYVAYRLAGPVIGRFKTTWGFAAPSDFAALPLGLLAIWLFCFVDLPINMAFRRHLEHEADRFGLELTHENHAAAMSFVKLLQANLGIPRPGTIPMIWFGSHPCIADRIEFCNTYHPWETAQLSKYEEYMKP
jgi:Zn-dependent protease with chaperone function